MDQRSLATAAAVFWFEVLGLLAVAAIVVVSPLGCFGDPAPGYTGPGPCPGGVPPVLTDGTLVAWGLFLGGTATAAALAWVATRRHPRARAGTFAAVGAIAAGAVVVAAVVGGLLGVVAFFWIGIPALLLLGSWLPALRRPRPPLPTDQTRDGLERPSVTTASVHDDGA